MILKKITKLTKNRDIGYASSGYIAEKVKNFFSNICTPMFLAESDAATKTWKETK